MNHIYIIIIQHKRVAIISVQCCILVLCFFYSLLKYNKTLYYQLINLRHIPFDIIDMQKRIGFQEISLNIFI